MRAGQTITTHKAGSKTRDEDEKNLQNKTGNKNKTQDHDTNVLFIVPF